MLHVVTLKHDSEAVSRLGSRSSPYVMAQMAGDFPRARGVCGAPISDSRRIWASGMRWWSTLEILLARGSETSSHPASQQSKDG